MVWGHCKFQSFPMETPKLFAYLETNIFLFIYKNKVTFSSGFGE